MSFDWKKTVATVAPAVGLALGGPLGGIATAVLCQKLGLGEGATEKQIAEAVMSPDNLVKIKQAEMDFTARMRELDIDLKRIAQEDRASAREMATASGGRFQMILACATIGTFVGIIGAILCGKLVGIDEYSKQLITYIIGQISGFVGTIMVFYYGSTTGSRDKDRLLYNSEPFDG